MFNILCGHKYKATPSKFSNERRCPQCNESKGEQSIRWHLDNKDVIFEREYSFEGLVGVGGGLLRFDFAVFSDNNDLEFLIEYDGEFHFKKFYEEQNFEELQIHDERKNQYCKDNRIPLLRIPYWDFDNIEELLFEKLNELEVMIA